MSKKTFITGNQKETRALGKLLVDEIKKGSVICLSGELGAGKTTFAQGLLKNLKVKGPYTSPTFIVLKYYKGKLKTKDSRLKVIDTYHLDAYRVKEKDILNLGWKELLAEKENIIIIEWADRIKKIIPRRALWIRFEWLDQNKRKITFK
jgi:tRNA threonylcarbamoyladenosine biosynthesis protein TsaE